MKFKITLFAFLVSTIIAVGQTNTPFYYQGYNSDGSPQTNPITFQAFPPVNGVVTVGNAIYFGGVNPTFTPGTNGMFTNSIAPNSYRCTIPSQSLVFYVNIPLTIATNSLALYLTNSPSIAGPVNGQQIVTTLLGYTPATNGINFSTTSNPTNSFSTGTVYANGVFNSYLFGFATGGILYYTNNSSSYWIAVTNNFSVPLGTNSSWSIIGGTLTNVVNWIK